jgi:hypothetical protein
MATLATRLTNTGTLYVNGTFDEITGSSHRTSTDTVYAGEFNEVTVNPNSTAVTNLWSYSQSFTSTGWSSGGSTIVLSTATTAPDGSNTAYKLISTLSTTSQYTLVRQAFNGQSTATIVSIYAKAAEKTSVYWSPSAGGFAHFNLSNGTVIRYDFGPRTGTSLGFSGASISPVGNGWYRCSATIFPDSANLISPMEFGVNTGTSTPVWAGDGVSGVYIWGAQIEYTASTSTFTPSMYVATTASRAISNTNGIQKLASNGTRYIAGNYDEFTGAPIVDASLVQWIDTAIPASYSGLPPSPSNFVYNLVSGSGNDYFRFNNGAATTATYSSQQGGIVWFGAPGVGGYGNYLQSVGTIALSQNNGAFTISGWFNSTTTQGNPAGTLGYQQMVTWVSNAVAVRWQFLNGSSSSPGQISYYLSLPGVGTVPTLVWSSSGLLVANQWYHIAVTYTGSVNTQLQIWLNGVNLTTTVYPGVSGYPNNFSNSYNSPYTISTSSGQLLSTNVSGQQISNNPTSDFVGAFSNYMVYNRVLSPDEINQNFNALRKRYGL